MAYVDDLLFFGEDAEVTKLFKAIHAQVLLRPTGELLVGHTISFPARQLTHKGEYIETTLGDKYMNTPLEEQDMHNSKLVNTPRTAALKTTTDETALTPEEHKQYRRVVGKLQWMTYSRPDICYATKELARDLTAPTVHSLQKLKHVFRYLQGTRSLNYIARPASMPTQKEIQIDVYTDADWAGCPATRKSTTGFVIQVAAGNTVHFGSRTQTVLALPSAENTITYKKGLQMAPFGQSTPLPTLNYTSGWADRTEVPHIPVGDGQCVRECVHYSNGEPHARADNWKAYMEKTYTKNTVFVPLNKMEYIQMLQDKELNAKHRVKKNWLHMELLNTMMDCSSTAAFLQIQGFVDYTTEDNKGYEVYYTWFNMEPDNMRDHMVDGHVNLHR